MARNYADTIWLNGTIWTQDTDNPWAQSIGVRNGTIIAVGTDDDLTALAGPDTKQVDLDQAFVMPGLIDTHVHAIWGGMRDLYEVYVGYEASLSDIHAALSAKAAILPKGAWIEGGPWRLDHLAQLEPGTPRAFLDQAAPDHPVIFTDATQHNAWANSLALRLAGIDAGDIPVTGGKIERDQNTGEPTGLLIEAASGLVRSHLVRSEAEMAAGVIQARDTMHRFGITAIKEPMASEAELLAYQQADLDNQLHLHLGCHIALKTPIRPDIYDLDKLETLRARYHSRHMQSNFAKLFIDGVAPSRTAAFFEPYLPASPCGCAPQHHDPDAQLLISPEELGAEVAALDAAGFTVKMHAVGDRAVRAGLDAIEVARSQNGMSDQRHEIAHTVFVDGADKARFKELNTIAEVSPKIWFPNPITAAQISVMGERRMHRCHPIASLLQAGAEVTYGSDWPAAAPDAGPWIGLSGMVTREDGTGRYPGHVGEDEAIPLIQALKIFTENGARALQLSNNIGKLKVGYSADFIQLDRNIFDCPAHDIAGVFVRETVFEGETVYQA